MHPFRRKNPCLVALKYTLRVRRSGKKAWYKVRYIKALRNVNGAREWLIAWDGEDDDGDAWPDTWEPTKNVSEDLREMYFNDQKQKVVRAITVDPRPLDGIVQAAISLSVQKGVQDTFGHTQITPIAALSLRDLAEYYLSSTAEKHGVEIKEDYFPSQRETIREVRLPYLTLPYLTLPYLTLPYLPYLTLP